MLTPEPLGPAALTPEGATVSSAGSTDAEDYARMVADDHDINATLTSMENRHLLDISSPAMLAINQARATAEQLARELLVAYRYLGGVP